MAEVDNYPSNSKSKPTSKPKIESVVQGKVELKKPSATSKVKRVLWGPHIKTAIGVLFSSYVIPAARDVLHEGASMFIEGMFNGGDFSRTTRASRPGQRGQGAFVNYGSYSKPQQQESNPKRNTAASMRTTDPANIIFGDRVSADNTLSSLIDIIEQYGHAKVSDLMELAGLTPSFTDNSWGWYDLSRASVHRYQDGWVIRLPRISAIE